MGKSFLRFLALTVILCLLFESISALFFVVGYDGDANDFIYSESIGVYPNGMDCTQAVNQALSEGKSIYFSTGTYYFSGTVYLKNAAICGAGTNCTTFLYGGKNSLIEADGCFEVSDLFLCAAQIDGTEKEGECVMLRLGDNGGVKTGSKAQRLGFGGCGTAVYESKTAIPSEGFLMQTVEMSNICYAGIDLHSFGRKNNHFANIYIGQIGDRKNDFANWAVCFDGSETNLKIDQLNIEHFRAVNSLVLNGISGLDLSSLHIEGMDIAKQGEGYIKAENTSGSMDSVSVYWSRVMYDDCSCILLGDSLSEDNNLIVKNLQFKGLNDPAWFYGNWPNRGIKTNNFKIFDRCADAVGKYCVTLEHYIPFTYQNDWETFKEFPCSDSITFLKKGDIACSGTTAERPTERLCAGYSKYFDTTLGQDLIYTGTNWAPVNEWQGSVPCDTLCSLDAVSDFSAEFSYYAQKDSAAEFSLISENSVPEKTIVQDFDDLPNGASVLDFMQKNSVTVNGGKASVGMWQDSAYTAFGGGDYMAMFYIKPENPDYGKCRIGLKNNVYLHIVGAKHNGNISNNTVSLYVGNSTVNGMPDADLRLADTDVYQKLGISIFDDGVYLRVFVTEKRIRVFADVTDDFNSGILLFDVILPDYAFNKNSVLEFSQGNTGLYFDNLTVCKITDGNMVNVQKNNNVKMPEIYSDSAIVTKREPENNALLLYQKNGALTPIYSNVCGNFTASWWLKTSNYDWDLFDIYLRGNYNIRFRGRYNSERQECYTASLCKGGEVLSTYNFSNYNPTDGLYLKAQVNPQEIKVWFSDNSGNFGTPKLSVSQNIGTSGGISVYRWDQTMLIDDIRIISDSGHIYVNDDFSPVLSQDNNSSEFRLVLSGTKINIFRLNNGQNNFVCSYGGLPLNTVSKIGIFRLNGSVCIYVNGRLIRSLGFKSSNKHLVCGKNLVDTQFFSSAVPFIRKNLKIDFNGDTKTDAADLIILRNLLVSELNSTDGDVNKDGLTDIRDLIALKKYTLLQ